MPLRNRVSGVIQTKVQQACMERVIGMLLQRLKTFSRIIIKYKTYLLVILESVL